MSSIVWPSSSGLPETGATPTSASTQPAGAEASATAPGEPVDAVKLTPAAEAKLLHDQGKSPQAIEQLIPASRMAVDLYLNVSLQNRLEETAAIRVSSKD